LNVPDNRIIPFGGGRINAERFVVSSLPRYEYQTRNNIQHRLSSPTAAKWIANRMKDYLNINSSESHRILITRKNAEDRRLINKSEVIDVVSEFGFQPYVLDEMALDEQIRLFANAEVVIGPHGAGFTNTIFSDRVTTIELVGGYYGDYYYVISNSLGHNHIYIKCDDIDGDLLVDTNALKSWVKNVLAD
jgi:PHD/YefM family antitoxin component YafN of YafNO toxin-antitoxin module